MIKKSCEQEGIIADVSQSIIYIRFYYIILKVIKLRL